MNDAPREQWDQSHPKRILGQGYSSEVQCLPDKYKVPSSVLSTPTKNDAAQMIPTEVKYSGREVN